MAYEIPYEDALNICGLVNPLPGTAQLVIKTHIDAQSTKYRACVEALKVAMEAMSCKDPVIADVKRYDAVKKIDAALAGLEG